ncbi:hypothetical protein Hanom_Chr08g00696621 [Helianthus anomalus]
MYVQEHAGNDKSCVWYVDDSVDDELFCIIFALVESMFLVCVYIWRERELGNEDVMKESGGSILSCKFLFDFCLAVVGIDSHRSIAGKMIPATLPELR